MEIYNEKEFELFEKHIDQIEEKLLNRENELLEPTLAESKMVEEIVLQFIRDNKRKVYGGYAQNQLIKAKNPADAFYPENDRADLDFYSPEPIEDLIKLSNLLYEKQFKYVEATEAAHKETYTIFVNFNIACDISYVPKNIYHRIPFTEINGVNYVSPSFIMIDIFRILTDPLLSGTHRWKKVFPRLYKLQKHYPFNKATSKLDDPEIVPEKIKSDHEKLKNASFEYFKNNGNICFFGRYPYNYFLEESEIIKDKQIGKKYSFLNVPYWEVISFDYQTSGQQLFELLKDKFPELADRINIIEYYPLWQFLGYSATFFIDETPFVHLLNYNRRCFATKIVPAKAFNEQIRINSKDTVQIVAFDVELLMSLSYSFRYRVFKEETRYHFQNIMTSHLIEMRNYFFEKTGKNMFDSTLFEEFIVNCTGDTIQPVRESRLLRKKRKSEKKMIVFRYDPKEGLREAVSNYKFPNSSGNPIRQAYNLRIIKVDQNILDQRLKDRQRENEEYVEEIKEEVVEDIVKLKKKTEN